jgi:hypothetical protein
MNTQQLSTMHFNFNSYNPAKRVNEGCQGGVLRTIIKWSFSGVKHWFFVSLQTEFAQKIQAQTTVLQSIK